MTSKTEKPTPKKLRDARKKGQVAKSKDLAKAAVFCGFALLLTMAGVYFADTAIGLLHWAGDHAARPFQESLSSFVDLAGKLLLEAVLPFLGLTIVLAILSDFIYSGPVFAPERLTPKFENINPVNTIKNWFSLRTFIELLKSMLKLAVLGAVGWFLVLDNLGALLWVPASGVTGAASALGTLLRTLLLSAAVIFAFGAGVDLLIQKLLFARDQKMTKDEVKREHKEMEGDPHIKQKRRKLHQELSSGNVRQAVRQSSVVVTNPTHIAVALLYVPGETPLPIVMAMEQGTLAAEMRDEAQRAGVPLVRQVWLARKLFAEAEVDDYIPLPLMEAVAQVLRALSESVPTFDQETW